MHTITTSKLSPVVVAAALRADDNAQVDGLPAYECLTVYWRNQIGLALPHRENAKLDWLADALAVADITDAVGWIDSYREFTFCPVNDSSLTRMMLDALLDWSKWTGDPRIDDARAQDWLRSLLA